MSTDESDEYHVYTRREALQGAGTGAAAAAVFPLSHNSGDDDGGFLSGLFSRDPDLVVTDADGNVITEDPDEFRFEGSAVTGIEEVGHPDDTIVRITVDGGNGFWTETADGAVTPADGQPVHVDSTDVAIDRYREQDALEAAAGTTDVTGAGSTGPTTTLSSQSRIEITSETDASGAASSGSGTESDPYIIDAKDMDNSEAAASDYGFYWNDPSASYHIRFVDFEIRNYDTGQIRADLGSGSGSFHIKNGVIYTGTGAAAGYGIIVDSGDVTVENTEFAGCDSQGIYAPSNDEDTLEVLNCEWTASKQAWGSTEAMNMNGVGSIRVKDVTAQNLAITRFLRINNGDRVDIEGRNWLLESVGPGIFVLNNGSTVGRLKLYNFDVRNPGDHGMTIRGANNVELKYGNVIDPPNGNRCIHILPSDGIPCRDVEVGYIYFEHNNGDGSPVNEAILASQAENVHYHDLWAGNIEEDGFETSDCKDVLIERVGGNIREQIVDIFGTNAAGKTEVSDVYGKSRQDVGVRITDVDNVTVSGELGLSASGPAVVVEQLNAGAGAAPNGCMIAAELPPPEDVNTGGTAHPVDVVKADGRIGLAGDIGTNNLATFYDGGIQRKVDIETY